MSNAIPTRFESDCPYKVLGVPRNATSDQIKDSYHKLAKEWHPDKNRKRTHESTKVFQKIDQAYRSLNNAKRPRYEPAPPRKEPESKVSDHESSSEDDFEQEGEEEDDDGSDFGYGGPGPWGQHDEDEDDSAEDDYGSAAEDLGSDGSADDSFEAYQGFPRDMHSLPFKSIHHIVRGIPRIQFCGRVVERELVQHTSRAGQRLLLTLKDESGSIRAVAWDGAADIYRQRIKMNKTYHFAGFDVKDKNETFNHLRHRYELRFGRFFDIMTSVIPCDGTCHK